ncbi:MAG: hypothetical protein AAFU71_17070 [Cyanobacteria bacterium J06632_22]
MTKRLSLPYLRFLQLRLYDLKSIDPKLDLGNSLTVPNFEKVVDNFGNKIEAYNSLLAEVEGLRSEIRADERDIRDLSERMLLAVGARFGKDSAEYKKAGGVRKSERQRPSSSVSAPAGDEGPPTVQPA